MSSLINRIPITYTVHTPRQAIQQGKAPAELADKKQTERLDEKKRTEHAKQENQQFKKKLQDYIA
jgi:hypothetical protein